MTDEFEFAAENDIGAAQDEARCWRILVVDDDPDVHASTAFALRGMRIVGRPLMLTHANSAAEARALLEHEREFAVLLLDVVMEADDAGLQLVDQLRRMPWQQNLRIILRTGQPGHAPETETIARYDINDYKMKSELTRSKLFASLTAAIRSYDQLQRLDHGRLGLARILEASHQLLRQEGLDAFAEGVITQLAGFIGTRPDGVLCARRAATAEDGRGYEIIAATGRYSHLLHKRLDGVSSDRVLSTIASCLARQATVRDGQGICLYFPAETASFAAYVDTGERIPEVDEQLLRMFCSHIALCGKNVKLVAELAELAYRDPLVGLPNRVAFVRSLDARLDVCDDDSVLALVDIDQFGALNDLLGHQHGDALLRAVAQRLMAGFGARCEVARVAGDAFGVFGSPGVVCPKRVIDTFSEPFTLPSGEQRVSVSVGLVEVAGGREGEREHGRDGASLLKNAYIALKRAKSEGIGKYAVFSEAVGLETRERVRMLHGLRDAFQSERLYIAFQPQVEIATRAVVGFEVLLRWRGEGGEHVPPVRFVPIAEQSGLIVPIGDWVLRSALHALADLDRSGFPGLRAAVNVSVVQFRTPSFVDSVDRALVNAGVTAERLELEVTESVCVFGHEPVEIQLSAFARRGISVAIDDFGTGFSSLSYLDRLGADRLKIDRSFVMSLGSERGGARIAEMVIALGRRLGMRTLAEGVEDEAQLRTLAELGCDEGQGYLFGRPMAYDAFREWLAQWPHGIAASAG
ncbi:MAG: EAL domain-containing protein [Rhodocyclaceae bacterium]